MEEQTEGRGGGLYLRLLLSVVLAGAFLFALWPYVQAVPSDLSVPLWVIPAYLLSLIPYHLLRAGRWQLLLAPLGRVEFRQSLLAGLAGYMWIALLPFRLGELVRPWLLAQRSEIRMTQALGSAAIERVVDGLLVCGLFFVGTYLAGEPEGAQSLYTVTLVVMGCFTAALLGLALIGTYPDTVGRFVRRVLSPVPKLADLVGGTATGIAEGLAALPSWRPLAGFVGISILYWLVNAGGMWLLAWGTGLSLSPVGALVVLAVMNLALLIPGGPAQLGVFQTGVALGLHLFVPAEAVAARGSVFVFYLYLCQLATIVVIGGLSQWRLGIDWRAVLRKPVGQREVDR